MEPEEFQIEKNIKDLEYNKKLNLITTYIVILATFVISVALAESLTFLVRIVLIVVVSSIMIYKIFKLHKELEEKMREIREIGKK